MAEGSAPPPGVYHRRAAPPLPAGRRLAVRLPARPVRGLVVLLVLLPALAGCVLVPPRPDGAGWRRDARQAVADVASEVATVDLTMRALRTEDLPGSYAVVVVAGSEEAAGAAAEGLSAAQPPDPERARYALVTGRLGDATDLLAEARIAVVAEDRTAYPDLIRRLVRAGAALDALERRLADLPPPVPR